MKLKKICSLFLCICSLFALCSCQKNPSEDKTDKISAETAITSDIVGVWIVESRENINGLTKDAILETWYPIGLEFEFTSDGEYIDKGTVLSYKILDEDTLEIHGDLVNRAEYQVSGDTLKMIFESNSYSVTFKRK